MFLSISNLAGCLQGGVSAFDEKRQLGGKSDGIGERFQEKWYYV